MNSTNKIEIKLKSGETLWSEGSCENVGAIDLKDELKWVSYQAQKEVIMNEKTIKNIESINITITFD